MFSMVKHRAERPDPETILRSQGLKVTGARIAILKVLASTRIPLDPKAIREKAEIDTMDRVTVYRTLAIFAAKNIVRRVDLRKTAATYELADDHHHHIFCVKCGSIEDFAVCDVDKIAHQVLSRSSKFKTIYQHSLELFGLCNSCVRKSA
jgi:Fe2+ or Zn2+ uptake regulation protein